MLAEFTNSLATSLPTMKEFSSLTSAVRAFNSARKLPLKSKDCQHTGQTDLITFSALSHVVYHENKSVHLEYVFPGVVE
jgi:hypothetical protein